MFKIKENNPVMKGCSQFEGYFKCPENGHESTSKLFPNFL